MAIIKCKMCGGELEIQANSTVAECEYCGSRQTVPTADNEKKLALFTRANKLRASCEFDKAKAIYERILEDDHSDPEAYWSLVLCRFGVVYVEDLERKKMVLSIHRTQFTSIFDDENYKKAIEYADEKQKVLYIEEANTINQINNEILAISRKEAPYDIFICYKEYDENGDITADSALANDLYLQLTKEGFKVFFSRILC